MARFLLRRIAQGLLTMVLAASALFLIMRMIPGDPALVYAGINATPEQVEAVRRELGLDQPLIVQYGQWITGLAHGDLGKSFIAQTPVAALLAQRMAPTLWLVLGSTLVMVIAATLFGLGAAMTRRPAVDTALTAAAAILYGAPVFWIGLLAILLFAVTLGWLPAGGFVDPLEAPLQGIEAMLMPCTVLGLALGASLSRFVRAAFKETMLADHVRLAAAKGASRMRIMRRHVARNAMIPIVTVFSVMFATLLGGTVIIESVFSWPGLGLLLINSVNSQDYPVVQALMLVYLFVFITINFLTDVSYSVIDPRIRVA